MDKLIEKVFKPGIQKLVEMFSYVILWVSFGVFGSIIFLVVFKIGDPILNWLIYYGCVAMNETSSCTSLNPTSIAMLLGSIFQSILEGISELFTGEDSSTYVVGILILLVIAMFLYDKIVKEFFPSLDFDKWSVKLKTKVMKSIFKDYKEPEKKD